MNGVVRAFNGPASQAFLPLVVPVEVFPSAVALGSGVFQGAMVVGPMVGGLVYGLTGSPAPVYAGSVVACLSAMVLMGRIRVKAVQRPRGTVRPGELLDGLRYLWRAKLTLGAISLDMFAVLMGGAVALMPVFARDILKVGAAGLGLLRGAPGTGAVIMAFVLAHRPLKRHAGAIMLCCVAGFGACTVVFGLSRNVALSVAALVLLGALRHGERDRAAYAGADLDAGRNARTGERSQHGIHRRVQRGGTIRIGYHGGMVWGRAGGSRGRTGDNPDCCIVGAAFSRIA